MNRRFAALTVLAALALGFLLVRTDTAEATSAHKNSFTSAYPNAVNTRLDSCSTCHTSAPSLNSYGTAFNSAGRTFTTALAAADSDRDGVSNEAEILAGTFPGDATDKPVVATTTTVTTAPSTTSPTTPSSTPSSSTSTTSTTVATTTSVPATVAATATSDADPGVFPMTIKLGAAGSVTLNLVDGKLMAEVNANWGFEIESEDDEVEVKFRNGESEIEFEAEYENGDLKIKIEDESGDHDDDDDDDDDRSGHDNHDEDEKRGRGHDDDDDDDDEDDDD